MFRLLRLLIGLVILAAIGLAAVTIPLGEKTLWEHVKAIAETKESKELVEGVKKKATKVIDQTRSTDGGKATDKLTDKERRALRELIRERLAKQSDGSPAPSPPKKSDGDKKKPKP